MKKTRIPFALIGGALALMKAACAAPETLCQPHLEAPRALDAWQKTGAGTAQIETQADGQAALAITQPAALGAGTTTVSLPLPAEKMRDAIVSFRARLKYADIAKPPQWYNGVKFMLVVETPHGKEYPGQYGLSGTADWKTLTFQATIPADATKASLVLGVEDTTGEVWVEQIQGRTLARAWDAPPAPASRPVYTGHPDLPRLRGAMVSAGVNADDLNVLGGQWRANLIRFQFFWVTPDGRYDGWRDEKAYDAWLDREIRHLDSLLPVCRANGLRVVVDLHTPPGGNILLPGWDWPLFQEKRYQDKFLAVWRKLAAHYKNSPEVWGYDLANEPIPGNVADGLMDWHTLATKAAQIVRGIDPRRAIIVEPGPGGSYAQLKYFAPIPVPGVVYSVHMYDPSKFAMQGVDAANPMGVSYPGVIDGVSWDKAQIEKGFADIIAYQKRYRVAIYIGEFSAVRWAPGDSSARYLSDCIDLFEKYGWDWSYHAFREWQAWSVELPSGTKDETTPKSPTDREILLRSWYNRNQRQKKKLKESNRQ